MENIDLQYNGIVYFGTVESVMIMRVFAGKKDFSFLILASEGNQLIEGEESIVLLNDNRKLRPV